MKSLLVAAALLGAGSALSQPINDNFADATIMDELPFNDAQDTTTATRESIDFTCIGAGPTVWYAYPATDITEPTLMEANTFGSNYDTTLTVAVGSPGAFTRVACNDDTLGLQSRVRFTAVPGETYYIVVAGYSSGIGGNLQFQFDVAPPPPPPLELGLSIQDATVFPSKGYGTVTGEVTCNNDAAVYVSGEITQRTAGTTAIAYFGAYVLCDAGEATSWSVAYESEPVYGGGRSAALMRGGPAQISAVASGYDAEGSEDEADASGTYRLRVAR